MIFNSADGRVVVILISLGLLSLITAVISQSSTQTSSGSTGFVEELPPSVIDINRALYRDFVELNGIGPVIARRILSTRMTQGPFREIEDLLDVKGIGPKTFARIEHLIAVCESSTCSKPNGD